MTLFIHIAHFLQLTSSDDRSIKVFNVDDSNGSFCLVEKKQLFGHTSRVFACRIINLNTVTYFISAGEDSNLCVWSENGDLLCKKNISASGIIWNLDFCTTDQIIVTCSSTGKLNQFKLRDILFEKHYHVDLSDKAQPAKLKFLLNGVLVVLDSKMNVHTREPNCNFKRIVQLRNEKFVAMEAFKNRLLLAEKNSVVVFDYCEKQKELQHTADLCISEMLNSPDQLDYLRSIHATSYNEFLVCDSRGLCCVVDIKRAQITNLLQIPKSIEPWTTSVERTGDFWIVGDRVGNLFVYDANVNQTEEVSEPLQKLWKLHGNLGVTTIKAEVNGLIKTTGNDGTLKTLYLDKTTNPPSIEVQQCERTSVNWIEKALVWKGREYLLGFNDNYFVVCYKEQIICYEHNCGGRHRHWDCFLTLADDDHKAVFAYIQKKQLHFVEFLISDFDLSSDFTWHTKDCNVIEAVDDLLISGGEDTVMKLSKIKLIDDEVEFEGIAAIHSHTSSIKAIATAREGEDLLIFSAGGRAQINVTRFIKMQYLKEELTYSLSKSSDSKTLALNPETRFTSIFYKESTRQLLVASSDGFIRVFAYTKGYFKIIVEHFVGRCLLKIFVIEDFVLTMATDGFINFWLFCDESKSLKFVDKLKHNDSGINCFDVFKSRDGIFSIGTSGDDMGVFITEFIIDGAKIEFLKSISSNNVHTAQITGLKFTGKNSLVTTSIDQTVCNLQICDSAIKIVEKKFTCVADVKGFVVLREKIAIYGAGFEILGTFTERK